MVMVLTVLSEVLLTTLLIIGQCSKLMASAVTQLWLPVIPHFLGCPIFEHPCPASRLGLAGMQNVPHLAPRLIHIKYKSKN